MCTSCSLGVGERLLRVPHRLVRPHPATSACTPRLISARVASCRLPARVGDGVGLEQRGRSSRWSSCMLRRADVDQRVRARVRRRRADSASSQRALGPTASASVGVLGQHRELRQPAVGARQLDRLAERLEDRDRLARRAPGARRRCRRTSATATGCACSGRPRRRRRARGTDRDGALDRRERIVERGRPCRPPAPAPRAATACSAGGRRSTKSAARR